MRNKKRLAAGAAAGALALALAGGAFAQETTGGVNGAVTDAAGHALPGVQVTVTFGPTNTVRTVVTDKSGEFNLRGLEPGGPYTIAAADGGAHTAKTLDDVQIPLGSPYEVNLKLDEAGAQTVVVRASRINSAINTLQTGPRSTFSATDIQTRPSFNRDLKDIARVNPFVTIDPTNSNALIIAGNSNRSNTVYVDGAKVSDDFGLNGNGYPGQRSPFSIDIVQSFNVEIAPMDVQYGSFTGGLLNVATKSGSNEFHGGGFYEYDSDKLGSGERVRDVQQIVNFKEKNYGLNLNGPIVPDKLFFVFNYEKYESQSNNTYGPSDSGVTTPVPGITSANVAAVQNILKTRYGFDPLGYTTGGVLPITDEKFFGKLTWKITDKQRLVFSIQDEVGSTTLSNDDSTTQRNLSLLSDWYDFDQSVRTYTGILYSDWTPNFHTEISYARRDTANVSNSLAGNDFAYFQTKFGSGTTQSTLYAGPNISRQANALVELDQVARIRGTYTLGQHTLLLGYEREQLDVTDLFVQNANGNYTFNNVTDLMNGNAASLTYANSFDNNKNTANVPLSDVIDTFYLQDEWRLRPDLTLKAGVRAELYEQSDAPKNNPYFAQQYGISNQTTLDGLNVVMPRIGLNYHPNRDFNAYLGAGLFSGGSPNVWIEDNYVNTGNLLGQVSFTCPTNPATKAAYAPGSPQCPAALKNVNGFPVDPSALAGNSASANAGTGITNAISPNFEPPSVWKFTAGFQKTFNFTEIPFVDNYTGFAGGKFAHNAFDGWTLHGDYMYQHTNKAPYWRDLLDTKGVIGTAPDGRPVYDLARFTADPASGRLARGNAYDLLLDSTDKGFGNTYAIGLQKTFDWGLTVDVTYTHTHFEEVNPGTSSVALSNYSQVAFSDANNPTLALSNYNVDQQLKFDVAYSRKIFGDNRTSIHLFGFKRSGLPFSYTFDSPSTSGAANDPTFGLAGAVANRDNELLYVPKADSTGNVTVTSDAIVHYKPGFNVAAFNQFLKDTGLMKYNGEISPRNAFDSRSVTDADIEITQEIPVFFPTKAAKAELYFDIFNIGNLINNSYGVLEQYGFPYFANDVSVANCNTQACTTGKGNFYEYQTFTKKNPTVTYASNGTPVSLWALKVGFRYKF